jgi:hypothetical protein
MTTIGRFLITATLMLCLASPADAANCLADDVRGRWDIYGFTDHQLSLEDDDPSLFDGDKLCGNLGLRVPGEG